MLLLRRSWPVLLVLILSLPKVRGRYLFIPPPPPPPPDGLISTPPPGPPLPPQTISMESSPLPVLFSPPPPMPYGIGWLTPSKEEPTAAPASKFQPTFLIIPVGLLGVGFLFYKVRIWCIFPPQKEEPNAPSHIQMSTNRSLSISTSQFLQTDLGFQSHAARIFSLPGELGVRGLDRVVDEDGNPVDV